MSTQSDAVKNTDTASPITPSASVDVYPIDRRCRYWAKVVRASDSLPVPNSIDGANDIPAAYLRRGEEELLPGDLLFEGEERHHARNRGWDYWLSWCGESGQLYRIKNPGGDFKKRLKTAGLPSELLPGSGQIAACVRLAHGIRLGLYQPADDDVVD